MRETALILTPDFKVPRSEKEPPQALPFAELAATTNFSFLRGGSHAEEMVFKAKELGLAGIGIAEQAK